MRLVTLIRAVRFRHLPLDQHGPIGSDHRDTDYPIPRADRTVDPAAAGRNCRYGRCAGTVQQYRRRVRSDAMHYRITDRPATRSVGKAHPDLRRRHGKSEQIR